MVILTPPNGDGAAEVFHGEPQQYYSKWPTLNLNRHWRDYENLQHGKNVQINVGIAQQTAQGAILPNYTELVVVLCDLNGNFTLWVCIA